MPNARGAFGYYPDYPWFVIFSPLLSSLFTPIRGAPQQAQKRVPLAARSRRARARSVSESVRLAGALSRTSLTAAVRLLMGVREHDDQSVRALCCGRCGACDSPSLSDRVCEKQIGTAPAGVWAARAGHTAHGSTRVSQHRARTHTRCRVTNTRCPGARFGSATLASRARVVTER